MQKRSNGRWAAILLIILGLALVFSNLGSLLLWIGATAGLLALGYLACRLAGLVVVVWAGLFLPEEQLALPRRRRRR